MADSKLKNAEQVTCKAVSGLMSDYLGFKLCDDGTVYSADICVKQIASNRSTVMSVHYNYVTL